jgi:hypothetical protein
MHLFLKIKAQDCVYMCTSVSMCVCVCVCVWDDTKDYGYILNICVHPEFLDWNWITDVTVLGVGSIEVIKSWRQSPCEGE